MKKYLALLTAFVLPLIPAFASAHEVYVLSSNQIVVDTTEAPFNMLSVATANLHSFLFWGFVAVLTVFLVFGISVVRPLERLLAPLFVKLRPYAPAVARITVGLGFITASFYQATFGPELPLAANYGPYAGLIALILAVMGTLIVIGFWARAAAVVALILFGISTYLHGWYMLTYSNYFGEILVLLLIGSHRLSVHSLMGWGERFSSSYHYFAQKVEHLAFPILRITFGISLIYASAYAKIFHNNLALQVASLPLAGHPYGLSHYFGMEPHFLVLGAAIVEIVIGLFFIFGIEIRFTSLFLLFWLSLSLWWFGEVVWPHIILIGIPIAFIFHGYDKYSLEGLFFKKRLREPIF
jgi:uncharacterized membrane protein YphA (DoxX/SURF4 family)